MTQVLDANGNIRTVSGAGAGASLTVKEDAASVVTATDTLDFKDFNIEDLGGNDAAVYHNLPSICNGRLTLTTAVPVTTADVTAAGTIYFAPYTGNKISLYDGTRWKVYTFTERSLALTLTSANVYDIFIYDNAGTLTLESQVWTSTTARSTALTTQDGVLVKSGATTRRYLGTIYATATNQTEDSKANRCVWNYYNRARRPLKKVDTAISWSYATATWRSWNNSTANRLTFVTGWGEEPITLLFFAGGEAAAANGVMAVGIALDVTNANHADVTGGVESAAASIGQLAAASYNAFPGIGYHYLQLVEYVVSGSWTFWGTAGTVFQFGATGFVWS